MRGVIPFVKDAWRLAWPYFSAQSDERWSARGLLLLYAGLKFGAVGINVLFSYWNNAWFTSMQEKDFDTFINLLLLGKQLGHGYMPGFAAFATLAIAMHVVRTYVVQLLQIRWRRWLSARLLAQWLADRAYYRISLARNINGSSTYTDNPDQRIAEDVRDFIGDTTNTTATSGVLALTVDLLATLVSLVSFMAILWGLSGNISLFGVNIPGYLLWVALIYSIIGTGLAHLVGRKLVPLSFRKQRVEADFRFGLVRVRENTEGIALYGGEAEEKRSLLNSFAAIVLNWRALMTRQAYLNALTSFYGQVASVFPFIVASPPYFAGRIPLGALTQTAQAFGEVQGAMSWFVDFYQTLATWRATVERLTTFYSAIEVARREAFKGVHPEAQTGDGYALHDATIALPGGQVLLEHTDIALAAGRPILISGRSGAGKSTLFRAFAGIWPFGSGGVQRPSGTSLFLPQRPYIPLGTLRHAVCYPAKVAQFSDAQVQAALTDAGLQHLSDRLDDEDAWTQTLSGGEQQRLALARALLLKPDWLFLDEATASLDPDSEAALYEAIQRRLPNTTVVSIAHRPALAEMHDRHFVLQRGPDGPGRLLEAEAAPVAD
jgi:vitamin B12/bleomycin/antimicrobial peptide transport system ATP-binding/permease protein